MGHNHTGGGGTTTAAGIDAATASMSSALGAASVCVDMTVGAGPTSMRKGVSTNEVVLMPVVSEPAVLVLARPAAMVASAASTPLAAITAKTARHAIHPGIRTIRLP